MRYEAQSERCRLRAKGVGMRASKGRRLASLPLGSLVLLVCGLQTSPSILGCRGCGGRYAPSTNSRPLGEKVDMHVHFSNRALPRALALMKEHGIGHAINVSGGFPGMGLELSLAAARETGGRISVMCNLPWRAFARVPNFVAQAVKILGTCKALGAVGLKIEKGLGLAYRDPEGKRLAVDDPRLDPIFHAAGTLGLPVLIHTGDPKAFWLPVDEGNERIDELRAHPGWSLVDRDVPSFSELWEEFARRVKRHPGTTFVGAHFGNAPEEPERVGRLLDLCPNLVVDTAARVPELGRQPPERLRPLFLRHQDRILFGTDLGVGPDSLMLGSMGPEPPGPAEVQLFFSATWRFFETAHRDFPHPTPIQGRWTISGLALPKDVLRKIYRDNAVRVFGLRLRETPEAKKGP